MKARTLLCLALLTGCEAPGAECDATWSVPVFREGGKEGTDASALVARDDSVIVAFSDSFSRVTFGTTMYTGAHLARVGADGSIVNVADGPGLPYAAVLAVDDDNGPVVQWGARPTSLVAYDAALVPRWSASGIGDVYGMGIAAIGRHAEVAYVTTAANNQPVLRFLGSDGVERWHLDGSYQGRGAILDSGDLVVFRSDPGGLKRVVVSLDGQIVRASDASRVPDLVTPDGDSVLAVFDPSGGVVIERRTEQDTLRWQRSVTGIAISDLRVGPHGEVAFFRYGEISAGGYQRFAVVELDGATGEIVAQVPACGAARLGGTFSDGAVITLGLTGSPSSGLCRLD